MRCDRLGPIIFAVLFFCLKGGMASPAFAVQPDERLQDAALERRARTISTGLRCLVCQNQSIDESDAPLAHDLRILVRERLRSGDSDDAVTAFIASRYGDFVLLKPPLKRQTVLLWIGPGVLLLFGALGIWRSAKRKVSVSALSLEEQMRLEALLDEDKGAK